MLRIDSYFTNGKVNKVCQDYVIHGETPVPHVILCDGCSSSKFTDVGARILAHSAKEALVTLKPWTPLMYNETEEEIWDNFGQAAIIYSKRAIDNLGLPNESLDATLMVMFYVKEHNHLKCFTYGDGSITILKNNEPCTIYDYSFEGNAPYYLTYRIDSERRKLYEQFSKEFNYTTQKQHIIFMDGRSYPFCKGCRLFNAKNTLTIQLKDSDGFNGALLSSDGISSFANFENADRISIKDIVTEFTAFKNFNGEFIKRRIKRAMEDLSKVQIHNTDDISVGGIIFND